MSTARAPKAGWYLMHRGWMDSADFKSEPFTEREAFLWSIEQAAIVPHAQWFNGVQYSVGRGEFVTSVRKMATAFQWGEKRARLFTARMERHQKWALRAAQSGAHAPTVLTVCNYDRFQRPERPEGTGAGIGEGTAGAQPGHSEGTQQKEGINNSNEGQRIEEREAQPPRSRRPNIPYTDAIAMWSEAAKLKRWSPLTPTLPLTPQRQKGLGAILKAHGLDGWREALQRALDSELLGGLNPPQWFNFDFICDPNKFAKVKDGNYDHTFSGNGSSGSSWLDANAALTDRIQDSAEHSEGAAAVR